MNESLGIVSLKCTGCGASLDITPDLEVFTCTYCGARQMVRRGGGTVSLKPLEEAISRVQQGTDRTASELAVRRLREDLTAADRELQRLRDEFQKADAGGQIVMFGGMGLCVFLVLFGQIFLAVLALIIAIAFAIPLFSRRFLGSARKSFAECEQRLAAKSKQIDSELQRHLELLNS